MKISYSTKTRLYIPSAGEQFMVLTDPESLSISKILRLKKNDYICCFNGNGIDYIYVVIQCKKHELQLELHKQFQNPSSAFPQTTVYLASTKGKTKDRMVKDLTPLGVTAFVFYNADRSVAKPNPNMAERLRKITIESCRQCERATIPEICILGESLQNSLKRIEQISTQTIFFYERHEEDNAGIIFENESDYLLIFGPEGGFSQSELEFLYQFNAIPHSLGVNIFRAELAAIVGTSIIQYKRGLLDRIR